LELSNQPCEIKIYDIGLLVRMPHLLGGISSVPYVDYP
jgi:hypothetical protein